jgi:sulfite reductase alpha subunit-like flavoprotein
MQRFPLPPDTAVISDLELLPSKFKLQPYSGEIIQPSDYLPMGYRRGEVLQNKRMTALDHFQDVRHMRITSEQDLAPVSPGDVLSLHPQNLPEKVNMLLKLAGWSECADNLVSIVPNDTGRATVIVFFGKQT